MNKPGNNIFVLFTCDTWKSTASMRLACATTSTIKLRKAVERCIHEDRMSYHEDCYDGAAAQVKALRNDWKTIEPQEINPFLDCGYIEVCENGQLI